MVDFPAPVAPTSATHSPGSTCSDTSWRTGRSSTYAKQACSISSAPRSGSAAPPSASAGVHATSATRSSAAFDARSSSSSSVISPNGTNTCTAASTPAATVPTLNVPLRASSDDATSTIAVAAACTNVSDAKKRTRIRMPSR